MEHYYIYQIKCKDTEIKDFYIGSTRHWEARKKSHKHSCINNSNYKLYKYININGGWDNWDMILLEQPCITKQEAVLLEKQYIINYKSTLNQNKPVRTKSEISEYMRNYQIKNKDRLKDYMKLYMRTYKKLKFD